MRYNVKDALRWWLIVCLQVLVLAIFVYFDGLKALWHADLTRLSYATIILWAVTSVFIGRWHTNAKLKITDIELDVGFFISETCLALGMIGTVVGFLFMLGTTFAEIDVNDVATLQAAIVKMAIGMSTALYTTLVGLVCSIFLKAQLVNLEYKVHMNERSLQQ